MPGRSRYTEAPPDNTLIQAIRCIGHAIRKSWDKDRKPVQHWLDRAQYKFDGQILRDVKVTLRVLLLFCTFPLFWALFYQTSTGMIFQAKRLNGLVGTYRIPPEMTSSVNPLLIITLIPLFDLVIYPLLDRLGVLTKTTSRMITGMIFAVTSFIVYALVNMSVEQTLIPATEARIHVYNTLPCQITVDVQLEQLNQLNVDDGGEAVLPNIHVENAEVVEVKVTAPASCSAPEMGRVKVEVLGEHETTLLVTSTGAVVLPPTLEYIKDEDAETKVVCYT